MVHAYHVVMSFYGFKLPNAPGSHSDFTRQRELANAGKAGAAAPNRDTPNRCKTKLDSRLRAALTYAPVRLSGIQARAVGQGFGTACLAYGYLIWACAILPDHVHLVIARHNYPVEVICNRLKGAATTSLVEQGLHPMLCHEDVNAACPPRVWTAGIWKGYLDSEAAVLNAMHYTNENPRREGKPAQRWSFVKPFPGIVEGGLLAYRI